ncbi:MAG: YraN family protein [Proteobacteria bacterium]|nr:YraN family protein [Pseudomonadota bacterium]
MGPPTIEKRLCDSAQVGFIGLLLPGCAESPVGELRAARLSHNTAPWAGAALEFAMIPQRGRIKGFFSRRSRLLRIFTQKSLRKSWSRARAWCSLGARGERFAARYLERNFFHVWKRNVRIRGGEIDLIASTRQTLVFVEIKTRSAFAIERFSGVEAVDTEKSTRLQALAARFIRNNRALLKRRRISRTRFDIIEIEKGVGVFSLRVRQHLRGL